MLAKRVMPPLLFNAALLLKASVLVLAIARLPGSILYGREPLYKHSARHSKGLAQAPSARNGPAWPAVGLANFTGPAATSSAEGHRPAANDAR